MSETIKKIYETMTHVLDFNQSILSGCIDVIVVEQPDGSLKSTPFHLRFGKLQALKGQDSTIDIQVNGQKMPFSMKLGRAGDGYFDLSQPQRKRSNDSNLYLTDDGLSEVETLSMSEDDSAFLPYNKDSCQIQQFLKDEKNPKSWKWMWGKSPQNHDLKKEDSPQVTTQPTIDVSEGSVLKSVFGIFKGKKPQNRLGELQGSGSHLTTQQITNSPPSKILKCESRLGELEFDHILKEETPSPNQNYNTETEQTLRENSEFDKAPNDQMEISLCSHLIKEGMSNEQSRKIFDANKIEYMTFLQDPAKFSKDNALLFRSGQQIYSKEVGLAMLLSKTVFGSDLKEGQIVKDKKAVKGSIWNRLFGSQINSQTLQSQTSQPQNPTKVIKTTRKLSEDFLISETSSMSSLQSKKPRKSLRPTSQMLKMMSLNYGRNEIKFLISTELQGLRELTGNIYLLKSDTKIVVSDIDGTITRSDIYGQLLPMMGTEWNHQGVAKFYQNISSQGYQLVYLTARGIGQSDTTKEFIHGFNQNGIQLPPGPIITSPNRLIPSLKREAIDKIPEAFKIQALKDIQSIFMENQCLQAGFGNRETVFNLFKSKDAIAYSTVGIEESRIMIIDTESKIHMFSKSETTDYESLCESIEDFFPCTKKSFEPILSPKTDERA